MSFIYRDRKDNEFSYGENPTFGFRPRRPHVVYERYYEDDEERQSRNLENFYAGNL